jgi:uncharacterized protein (TIGR02118 family)
VSRFVVIYRRPEDPEAFDSAYRETHLPLVAKTPGLTRIEASRVRKTVHGEPDMHLIAVMHFTDPEAMRVGLASAEWAAAGRNLAQIGGLDLATMMIVDDPVVEEITP